MGRIVEGLGPGGHGAAGFDDVSAAVATGRVHTLLVDRHHRASGWRCLSCRWVGLSDVPSCPLCGGKTTFTADAAGELIRLTILEHGQIEVAERLQVLDDLGGVVGLLRYA